MVNRKHRVITVMCLCVLAGIAASIGIAGSSDNAPVTVSAVGTDQAPYQYAATTTTLPAVQGGAVSASSLVDTLLVGVPSIAGANVQVVPDLSAGGWDVDVVVPATGTGSAVVLPVWEAEVLAGALKDDMAANGLGKLANFLVSYRLPNGSVIPDDSGFGNVPTNQWFDTADQSTMASDLSSDLDTAGLKPLSIAFATGVQSAPIIVAETDDPESFVKQAEQQSMFTVMLGDYNDYEGYYLEVVDTNGSPVAISAAANRAGSTLSWVRSDLRAAAPLVTGAIPTQPAGEGG